MNHLQFAISFGTHLPRDEAIQKLEELARETHVDIVDFHMFSNLSLAVQIEAQTQQVVALVNALRQHQFLMTDSSHAELESLSKHPSLSEIHGSLQVTFANENGELRNPVPMVPG